MKRCKLFPNARQFSVDNLKKKGRLTYRPVTSGNNTSLMQSSSTKDSISRQGRASTIRLSMFSESKRENAMSQPKKARLKAKSKTKAIQFQSTPFKHSASMINNSFYVKAKTLKAASPIKNRNAFNDDLFLSSEDTKVNHLLQKQIKCQQLKTEVILSEQKDGYLSKDGSDQAMSPFLRKIDPINLFQSKASYDKDRLYKQTDLRHTSHSKHLLDIDCLQREAKEHGRQLSNEINTERGLSSISSTRNLKKRKGQNKVLYEALNTSLCKSELELVNKNQMKVNAHIDNHSKGVLRDAINSMLYLDEKLNKKDEILSDTEAKAIVYQMNKEFNKVVLERSRLKKLLKLKEANWRMTDRVKMLKTIKRYRIGYLDRRYLKEESERCRVLKTVYPLTPRTVKYKRIITNLS